MRSCLRLSLLAVLLALVASACAEERLGEPLQPREFQFPTGLAVHPAGFALVVSSNVDLAHVGGALRVIDLNRLAAELQKPEDQREDFPYYRHTVVDDEGIGLDNFAGTVAISEDGKLAAVTVRETGQLALFDLDVQIDGGQASIDLTCWSVGGRPEGNFPVCKGSSHLIDLGDEDPYDVILLPTDLTEAGQSHTAFVTFLRSGDVAAVDIPADRDDVPQVLYRLGTTVAGTSDLAQSPGTGLVYVTSRFPATTVNPVYYFDPYAGEQASVRMVDFFDDFLGNETRSLAFAADGVTAGLLVRNPDMLVFIDTSLGFDGKPLNGFLGAVMVGNNPSRVRAHGDLMFVTGAQDDSVHVIDAKVRRLSALREDVCVGPFEVGFWDGGDKQWALISCFEDETVAVLDVDPASTTFLDVLARVGKPRKGAGK